MCTPTKQFIMAGAANRPGCCGAALGLLLAALFWSLPAYGATNKDDGGQPNLFRTGFMQRVFSNTDPRDAKAVLEVHSREISRLMGLKLAAKVVMFSEMDSMNDALRRDELELAAIPSMDYLRIRSKIPLIPSFVGISSNGPGINYVIITRKESGIRSFAELKGRSIHVPSVDRFETSKLWLEVLLMKAGITGQDTFFSLVKESPKVSNSIMAVFFRQADAALVTRTALDTSSQLNPQMEKQLAVIAESPNLSDSVVCLMPGTSEKYRIDIYKAMLSLNESKTGRQIYTIFQTNGITPFKPEYLEGLEGLLREHKRLKAKTVMRK